MAAILNYDQWDWVHPKTNKVTRLVKGDEVPDEILSFSGDPDAFFAGPRPVLLKKEAVLESGAQAPSASTKNVESKKDGN